MTWGRMEDQLVKKDGRKGYITEGNGRSSWERQVIVTCCTCQWIFFNIIIYFQHAPLHWYAILHACFIIYSSIVSVTLITHDYNGPCHNLSKSIEFVNCVKYFKYLFISSLFSFGQVSCFAMFCIRTSLSL